MADTRIEFKYDIADVTSAQRMRFLNSKQFKLIIGFWGITVALMTFSILFPRTFTLFADVTWALIGQISLIYFGTLFAILVMIPWLGFHFNRFWRLPLVFQFNTKNLRLSVAGKPGGLRLTWSQIRRVEGTDRVFLIYYDEGQKHFILPRAAFKEAQEKRFHQMLERYGPVSRPDGQHPAAQVKAADEQPAAVEQPAADEPADALDENAGFETSEDAPPEIKNDRR
jgi:hypothetical protein